MKKLFALIICLAVLAAGGYYAADYTEKQKTIKIENMAQTVMALPFARFVTKWDLGVVVHLFVEGAQVRDISKMLTKIKNGLGSCTLTHVDPCEAASRHPGNNSDFSFAGKEAVSCPFTLSCEKGNAHGVSILFYEYNGVKIYRFSLSVDKETTDLASDMEVTGK